MSAPTSAGPMTTDELFRQHASFVARFLTRLGVPAEHIEDALQEVFLVVHRQGGYRPGVAKPTSYLAGIAIHAATKHRRRERAGRARHSDLPPEQLVSEHADPTRAVQAQQELERLQRALDRLPDELRTTLLLVEVEGESCLSVAAAFGWPVGTVYWRLHEARKKLQTALKSLDAEHTQQRRLELASARPERRRAAGASSLGMLMLFGDAAFQRSEAGQLLRLAREQNVSASALAQLVARHGQLVQAGAPLPSWAASYTPHAASWLGLLGASGTAAVLAFGGVMLATALVWLPARSQPHVALDRPQLKPHAPARAIEPIAPLVQPAPVERAAGTAVGVSPAAPQPPASAGPERPAVRAVERAAPVAKRAARATAAEAAADTAKETATETATEAKPVAAAEPESASKTEPKPARAELIEMQETASAERLLASEPARALAIAKRVRARFPAGYFREEQDYVEVMALLQLGRTQEGHAKATVFLRSYPDGPYSRRVRAAAGATR